MSKDNTIMSINYIIECIMMNYKVIKEKFKDAIIKSRLVENIINIYAQNGFCLTEKQIESYQSFVKTRQEANERFERLITRQDCFSTEYLLKDNAKPDALYEKVLTVKENQSEMLELCERLIESSNEILDSF